VDCEIVLTLCAQTDDSNTQTPNRLSLPPLSKVSLPACAPLLWFYAKRAVTFSRWTDAEFAVLLIKCKRINIQLISSKTTELSGKN